MYTNSSSAASLAPGWHTLGSTPIKITSLSRYTGEHQPVPVSLSCILSLPPFALLWVQEEVTFAARQSNGTPGGVCPVSAQAAGSQQCAPALNNMPPLCNGFIHREQ